jgi:rfaE bifunctional protein nucleotidyltransferase chain/domain
MDFLKKLKSKIIDLEQAQKEVSAWKSIGDKVVFTNGCFDILHRGHVVYLAKSAALGQRLIIGLNDDLSVKEQNKGAERPINDEKSRAIVLAALEFVDAVILYNDKTPIHLIAALKPDILVKGADYDEAETDSSKKTYIVGSDVVKASGGEVKTISLEEGFSTTAIVNKLKA